MGKWIKQTAKPCEHPDRPKLPTYHGNEHIVGDIWECDCKQRFVVSVGSRMTGGQWDDPYEIKTLEWKIQPVTVITGSGVFQHYPDGVRKVR